MTDWTWKNGPGCSPGKTPRSGVASYDAARFTDWTPDIRAAHVDSDLSSVWQTASHGPPGANETIVPANGKHNLIFFSSGASSVYRRIGDQISQTSLVPWEYCYLPPDVSSIWHSTPAAAKDVLHLHLDDGRFRSVLSEIELVGVDPGPIARGADVGLSAIARMARADLNESFPPDRLAWSSYAALLAVRLARLSSSPTSASRAPACDWRLRRAIEYLEARIGEPVSLDELAGQVGVSQGHLVTLFQSGLGSPPHRWLMQRRIERACEMLRDARLSVTEVALACGYSSSQHFATAFRKRMGATPSRYRRERLA